jgi:hypothetical protein
MSNTKPTFEDKIRQYATLFDGAEMDFSAVETTFSDLYHDDFLDTDSSHGEEINKDAKKQLDEQRLVAGAKVTNVANTRKDWNKVLVEFHLERTTSQFLVTIKDKKIVEAQNVNRLVGFINAYYLI